MSTSETTEHCVGACPCGGGHVVLRLTTQDNPWSGVDRSHYIDCDACRRDWRVDQGNLVSRAEVDQLNEARRQWHLQVEALDALIAPLVDRYYKPRQT